MIAFLLYTLFFSVNDHPGPPFSSCETPNLSGNSPYRSSLDNLLSSMSSNLAPDSKFFQTSAGTGSARVYGLFLCYDYSPQVECQKCVETSSLPQDVSKLCPYKEEAAVWEEYCLFRYSTRNFSGELDVPGNIPLYNVKNVTDPQRYRSIVNRTLHDLAVAAAFDPSSGMHSSGSRPFPPDDNLYTFVQCSNDLSPSACNVCLSTAIEEILVEPYYFSRGARVLSRSCFLRYELYNFVQGEPESEANPNAGRRNRKRIIAAVASGAGTLALSALGLFVFRMVRRKRANSEASDEEEMNREDSDVVDTSFGLQHGLDPQECPFIEMKVIREATDNFSDANKLGEGGFGPVFKGILREDGQFIAVKRLSINSEQGSEEFKNEVLLIHKLQHVNLVKLIGFCDHQQEKEKLLIYEYMPNGSLDSFLFDSRKRAQLKWRTRMDIINGVARGMLYLHQDSRLKIIHRDLKPSNILLDSHMKPKISDFGMAKIFGGNDGEANTAKIVGTYGYMAPEFAMEGIYSIKSDVFSFGVLLLEIITGRRNARFHISKLGPSLLAYAWKSWNEGNGLELMDPLLADSCAEEEEEEEEEFMRCMHIGLLCVQEDARERPSMASVVRMLNRDSIILSQPERPSFFSVGNLDSNNQTCLDNLSLNNLTISDVLPR